MFRSKCTYPDPKCFLLPSGSIALGTNEYFRIGSMKGHYATLENSAGSWQGGSLGQTQSSEKTSKACLGLSVTMQGLKLRMLSQQAMPLAVAMLQ
jgi:hypothetical protein